MINELTNVHKTKDSGYYNSKEVKYNSNMMRLFGAMKQKKAESHQLNEIINGSLSELGVDLYAQYDQQSKMQKTTPQKKCNKLMAAINDSKVEPELQVLLKDRGKSSPITYINEWNQVVDIVAMQTLGLERFCANMMQNQDRIQKEFKSAEKQISQSPKDDVQGDQPEDQDKNLMLRSDRIKKLKAECRVRAIENSPLNQYIHTPSKCSHTRKKSSLMWDNFSDKRKKSLISFDDIKPVIKRNKQVVKIERVNNVSVSIDYRSSILPWIAKDELREEDPYLRSQTMMESSASIRLSRNSENNLHTVISVKTDEDEYNKKMNEQNVFIKQKYNTYNKTSVDLKSELKDSNNENKNNEQFKELINQVLSKPLSDHSQRIQSLINKFETKRRSNSRLSVDVKQMKTSLMNALNIYESKVPQIPILKLKKPKPTKTEPTEESVAYVLGDSMFEQSQTAGSHQLSLWNESNSIEKFQKR